MVPTGIIPCLPWDLVFLSRCHDEDLLFLNVRGSEHKILITDGWVDMSLLVNQRKLLQVF